MEIGILGGGIAGLSVALALRQKGYSPRVYERRTAPATMGAGVTLWPNASFVLKELGLLKDVEAIAGQPLSTRRQDAAGNALGGLDIALLNSAMGYPSYTVLRRDLQQVQPGPEYPWSLGTGRWPLSWMPTARPLAISRMALASAPICSLEPMAA